MRISPSDFMAYDKSPVRQLPPNAEKCVAPFAPGKNAHPTSHSSRQARPAQEIGQPSAGPGVGFSETWSAPRSALPPEPQPQIGHVRRILPVQVNLLKHLGPFPQLR